MRKGILNLVCAAIAVMLLCFPSLLWMQAHNSVVRKWLNGGRLTYQGELAVWVVDANVDGKGALRSWILGRSTFYKQRNFGIYPIIEPTMTLDQVRSRIASGEIPDVLLCGGDVPQSVLDHATAYQGSFPMPLVLPQRGKGLFTPVMHSGTVLLINEDALYRAGLNPPAGVEGMDEQWISYSEAELSGAFCYDDALSLMAVVLSDLPPAVQQALLNGSEGNMQEFLNGSTAVFATTQAALWQLYRQELLGRSLPDIVAYPLCGFAPRVQYAVLMQNADTHRQAAASALITILVGNKGQIALADIYALPVVSGTTCERTDLMGLWQCAQQTKYVYPGHGEVEFMDMVREGATPDEARAYAIDLCRPP